MALQLTTLLSVALFPLLGLATLTQGGPSSVPIRLSVENELSNDAPASYSLSVVEGGVLLGAMRRLQNAGQDFKFTVTEDPDFGLLLESVNGVAGSESKQTYWALLSESSGQTTRLEAGIGCYTPKANEHIILRLSTWSEY